VYVSGDSTGVGTGEDFTTVAYDSSTGARRWHNRYDGAVHGDDSVSAITTDPAGTALFLGGTVDINNEPDMATAALSAATGKKVWLKSYDGPGHHYDFGGYGIAVAPDGSRVFVGGISTGLNTGYDITTLAYATGTGKTRWVSRLDDPSHNSDYTGRITMDPGGQAVYVIGSELFQLVVAALDPASGQVGWSAAYGTVDRGAQGWNGVVSPDGQRLYAVGGVQTKLHRGDFLTVAFSTT